MLQPEIWRAGKLFITTAVPSFCHYLRREDGERLRQQRRFFTSLASVPSMAPSADYADFMQVLSGDALTGSAAKAPKRKGVKRDGCNSIFNGYD